MGTIADGNVIEADDVLSSMRTTAEAGEAITIGKACYIKESDGKAYISDKATANFFTGIAYAGVDSGADVTLVTKGKFVTTSLTDKEVYYLGSSGAISTTASGIRIGSADGTTDLYIDTSSYNEGASRTILAGYDTTGGNHTNSNVTETQIGVTSAGITPNQQTYVIKAHFYIKRTAEYTVDTNAAIKLYRGDAFIGATEIASGTLYLIPISANSGNVYASNQNVMTMMYVETTGGNFSGSEKVWASCTFSNTDGGNVTVYCEWIEVVGYGE